MSLKNDIELANSQAKLARLEARYEALRNDTEEDEHVRELTLRSLKRYINQFQEEITRSLISQRGDEARHHHGVARRRVLSDIELTHTRHKLRELERLYEDHQRETDGDERLRDVSMTSLKRLINQLKEEIIWTEVHQPSPSEAAAKR